MMINQTINIINPNSKIIGVSFNYLQKSISVINKIIDFIAYHSGLYDDIIVFLLSITMAYFLGKKFERNKIPYWVLFTIMIFLSLKYITILFFSIIIAYFIGNKVNSKNKIPYWVLFTIMIFLSLKYMGVGA